jgi:hypothetical protein
MSDINALFPSKYLKASDLHGDTRVTIVGVETQEVGDREQKPVVVFREAHLRPLVLNRTNANSIAEVLGSPMVRDWVGKQVTLYPATTEFQGKRVPCIRVRDRVPQARTNQHEAPPQHRQAPNGSGRNGYAEGRDGMPDEGRWA